MHWTRTKRLIAVLIIIVVAVLLLVRRIIHYHSEETDLVHQLQQRGVFLSKVWSKCFHATMDYKDKALEHSDGKNQDDGIQKRKHCKVGFIPQNGACVACPQGTFALEQWAVCTPLLTCNELSHHGVQVGNPLYSVGNWRFRAARWNNYDVLYALLSADDSTAFDFEPVQRLLPHDNLLYPIGLCDREEKTELLFAWSNDVLGRADKLDLILACKTDCDNEIGRFKLAIDFIRILVHLHSNKTGNGRPLVLCNSHSLPLLLSQFLITDDLRLVLGAFDNLPAPKNTDEGSKEAKVKCSQRELKGSFVSPEQRWPYQSSKVFNPVQQPGYTEKSDIWKIPDITRALLSTGGENILDLLEVTHRKCKNREPSGRPTAIQVLQEYQFVWDIVIS